MSRVMSDTEIRHRKKVQGTLSQVTGGLGLAALGGSLAASRGGRTALRKVPALKARIAKPKPLDPNRDKIQAAVTPVLATSAGLGGIGSFNFAAYTNAESKKRKAMTTKVQKSLGPEMGYYGEEGHQIALPEIEALVEKAWSPVASNYDPEALRRKRAQTYETALGTTSGLAAGGAATAGASSYALRAKNKQPGQVKAAHLPNVKTAQTARAALARSHGKTAGALAGVSAAAAGGAALVNRKRKGSWQSYGKRDEISAFGVDHH